MKKKNTGTIPIVFANPAKVWHTSLPREGEAVRALCFVLACLIVGYVALVSMSVVNVIASQEAADKMSALRTVVGALEHDYFERAETVTSENGSMLGLTQVSETHYVNRSSTVATDNAHTEI